MQINDLDHLRQVLAWYTPDTQPRTRDEGLYVGWVAEAAEYRIQQLEKLHRNARRRIDHTELEGVRRNLAKEWEAEELARLFPPSPPPAPADTRCRICCEDGCSWSLEDHPIPYGPPPDCDYCVNASCVEC